MQRILPLTVAVLLAGGPTLAGAQSIVPVADDLTDPGHPLLKRPFTEGLEDTQGLADHFDYDSREYVTARADLHGTTIEIAVHVSAPGSSGPKPEQFARFVTDTFHAAWHVFGGFAFDHYAVKVRAADDLNGFSLSPVGVSISAADYGAPSIWEFVAHEMFHSWNGGILRYPPDGSGNLFQTETWVAEGVTVYYSFRLLGSVRGEQEYRNGMEYRWRFYDEHRGTPLDRSISELASDIGASQTDDVLDGDRSAMLYARGAMLAYLLDGELTRHGSSLEELMRRLYARGLNGEHWTEVRLPDIVQELIGARLDAFFAHVHGSGALPITGRFQPR